jgi:prevent-host-death family protein
MASITMRKLVRDTASVIDELSETGEPVLIVRKGQPVAALVPVDREQVENIALATAPDFKASLTRADEAAAAGETATIEQIFPKQDTTSGGSQTPPAGVAPSVGEYTLDPADEHLVDALSGVLVAQLGLGATAAHSAGAHEIPPERVERIQELAQHLARRVVAENVGNMVTQFCTVSDSIVDASCVGDRLEFDRYEHMWEAVAERRASAPQDKMWMPLRRQSP